MPRDLFAELETPEAQGSPRDLFAEFGVAEETPPERKKMDLLPGPMRTIVEKAPIFSLFPGGAAAEQMRQTAPEEFAKGVEETMLTPAAHYLNQRMFNLPRAIAYQMGYEYPEAETTGGQIMSKAAGVVGMTQAVSPALEKITKFKTLPKTAAQWGQTALKGAGYGALYTPTEDIVGLPQRMTQAVTGAIFAPAVAGATRVGGMITKGFRKQRFPKKSISEHEAQLTKISKGKATSERQVIADKTEQELFNKTREIDLHNERIAGNIADEKLSTAQNIKTTQDYYDNVIRKTNEVMTKRTEQVKKTLIETAETEGANIRPLIEKWFKKNSEQFGNRVDDAMELMAKRGVKITLTDQADIIQKTLGEVMDAGLGENSGYGGGLHYNTLMQMAEELEKLNPLDEIPLKNFMSWSRELNRRLPAGVRMGADRFKDEQIVAAIFMKNIGKFIETKISEFAATRSAYKPVIQAMVNVNKWFRPLAGEQVTTPATSFLKRFGEEKLVGTGEKESLRILQEGVEGFAPGIGKKSFEKVTSAAGSIRKTKESKALGLFNLSQQKEAKLSAITEKGKQTVGELQKQKISRMVKEDTLRAISGESEKAKEVLAQKLEARLTQITKGKYGIERLERLRHSKALLQKIAGLGGVGIGVASYLVHRAIANAVFAKFSQEK